MEDELLATLEELAQKTDVLTHWADEMYEAVKAVPQSQVFFVFIVSLATDGRGPAQSPFPIPPNLHVVKVRVRSMPNDGGTQIKKRNTLL